MSPGAVTSSSSLPVAALALVGCQTIIGISGYEIGPASGDGAGGDGVASDGVGGGSAASGGQDDLPVARGGHGAEGGSNGSAGEPGAAGAGGANGGCRRDSDCDDAIGCTDDSCRPDGVCEHSANHALCVPTPGNCLSCQLGIGCVKAPTIVQELLIDGSFDLDAGAWIEESESYDQVIVEQADAHTGTRVVRAGPAPPNAVREYANVYQWITVPAHTQSLQLTGYYQLEPGLNRPGNDELFAACFEVGEQNPLTSFHDWVGSRGPQNTWKAFSVAAPRSEVLQMWGNEYSFDLVAHTVGTVFRFDSLSLQATICE